MPVFLLYLPEHPQLFSRPPRRVAAHTGVASGIPILTQGSWKALQWTSVQNLPDLGGRKHHGLVYKIMYILNYFHIEIFKYFRFKESSHSALEELFLFLFFFYTDSTRPVLPYVFLNFF